MTLFSFLKRPVVRDVLIIFLLSLVPLLWFKTGHLITGVDVDFPLFPLERWDERIHVWLSQVLGGIDRSNNSASLFFVLLQALLSLAGLFSVITVEKITFVFWAFAMGLSIYFLMRVLITSQETHARIAILTGVLAYLFNPYNAFVWARLQIDIAALVLFPAFFGLIILATDRRLQLLHAFLSVIVLSIICGAIGIQPPLVFILFFSLFFFLLFYLIKSWNSKKEWIRILKTFFSLGLAFALGSLYWLLPLIHFVTSSGYGNKDVGVATYSVYSLIDWVSSITDFKNVFRFFGDVTWFDGFSGQPYAPAFEPYLHNTVFILLSFLLPLIVFLPFLFKKTRQLIRHDLFLFFAGLTLLSLFFAKGSHAPLGGLYLWLVDHFPLFWIQRAPWQKFTMVTTLGYSILAGVSIGLIYQALSDRFASFRRVYRYLFIAGILVYFVGYNFFFTLGKMFPDQEGDYGFHELYNFGYHHQFPAYSFLARNWVNDQQDFYKIGLFPDDKTNTYRWGFSSAGDLTSQLFHKGLLFRQYGEGFAPPNFAENVYQTAVRNIYETHSSNASKILQLLGVKYILQRNDIFYDFFGDVDSPTFIAERLAAQNGIKKVSSFGPWDFYEIENAYPIVYVPETIYQVESPTSPRDYFQLFNPELFSPDSSFALYTDSSDKSLSAFHPSKIDVTLDTHSVNVKQGGFAWAKNNKNLSVSAVYYPGTKRLVRDDGQPDPTAFVFPSSSAVPYPLLNGAKTWDASDSTIVYVQTGNAPLTLNNLVAEGHSILGDVNSVFFEASAQGPTGVAVQFPITIPKNQRAILQINKKIVGSITYTVFGGIDLIPSTTASVGDCKPVIEYKRVNSIKYLLNVHGVCQTLPLVISENFHPGWKIYANNNSLETTEAGVFEEDYKILKGNSRDQATLTELGDYIAAGWISSLGDGTLKERVHTVWKQWRETENYREPYVIDFISKNNRGTIQNDNLNDGSFADTFFKEPLFETHHSMANGYANSWIIDPKALTKADGLTKNADGTFDLNLIVEFWPQRLLILGFFLTGFSLALTTIVVLLRRKQG